MGLVSNILMGLCIIVIILSLVQMIINIKNPGRIPSIAGFKFMTVLTGSMQPSINAGDVIAARSKPAENVKVGDVITYRTESGMLVTHRVIQIVDEGGIPAFITKGDANNTDDGKSVSSDQLVGILAFRIPYAGYIGRFAGSTWGFILLVVIPALILLADEVGSIIFKPGKHQKNAAH